MEEGASDTLRKHKKCLTQSVVLARLDLSKHLCLFTDASDLYYAACLTAVPSEDTEKLPTEMRHEIIDTLCGKFTGSSERWSIQSKEAFAIREAMEKFCHWLDGPNDTIVFTDSQVVKFIFDPHRKGTPAALGAAQAGRVARWALFLRKFSFVLRHLPGSLNKFADFLSRDGSMFATVAEPTEVVTKAKQPPRGAVRVVEITETLDKMLLPEEPRAARVTGRPLRGDRARKSAGRYTPSRAHETFAEDWQWPSREDIIESQRAHIADVNNDMDAWDEEDGLIVNDEGKVWCPRKDRHMKSLLCIVGHQAYCAHRGVDVTTRIITDVFFWPNQIEEIKTLCFQCLSCLKASPAKLIPRPWGTTIRATRPNEVLSMDYMQVFPLHAEIPSFVLIIRDNFSTFCELTPSHRATSIDAAKALCQWFSRYGYKVTYLLSDRGSHFIASTVRRLVEMTRTKQHFHQPYAKWSNGTVERSVRVAREAFRLVIEDMGLTPAQWPQAVPLVQMIMNTNKRRDLGYKSPAEIFTCIPQTHPIKGLAVTGTNLKTVKLHTPDVNKIRTHLDQLSDCMRRLHTEVVDRRLKRQLQNRRQQGDAIPGKFQVGDFVLCAHRQNRKRLALFANWTGPWIVKEQLSEWLFTVQLLGSEGDANTKTMHSRLMKFFAASDCNKTRQLCLSAQTEVDMFEVERITDYKYDFAKQELLLQVKWKGFDEDFQTFEPVTHMLNYCRHLVVEFLRNQLEEKEDDHIQIVLDQILDGSMEASIPDFPTQGTQETSDEASASAHV